MAETETDSGAVPATDDLSIPTTAVNPLPALILAIFFLILSYAALSIVVYLWLQITIVDTPVTLQFVPSTV